jgi:AraC-like DNA-binding protein
MGPSRQKDRDALATTRARRVRAVARARHRTAAEAGRWRMETERWGWPRQAARPHPALRQLLARDYWGITSETAPHRLLVPATVSVPLVLKICDSPHRPPAFLHGVHDRFAVMDGDCASSYVEIWMAPFGAYQLLGRPVRELGGEVVDMESVFGAAGRRLLEAVRERSTWRGRFAAVDSFLLKAAERGPRPSPEVIRAWHLLIGSGGAIPIGNVAADVGWSHKHLIAKFTEQVGLRPKTAARLIRFDAVWRRLDQRRRLDWGQVAADAGYADQAHLVRDFRQFTGTTPTRFQARTLPPAGDGEQEVNSVQDAVAASS